MSDWREILPRLVQDRENHGRFVNTLSLLEYIGARKIVKSQAEADLSAELLSHIAEEIRHAQLFKRLALTLSDGALDTFEERHLLAPEEGRGYIQSIDHGVEKWLDRADPRVNYLLSTLLIEVRAGEVYPVYEQLLGKEGGVLRAIIRDEEKHLSDIRKSLDRLGIEDGPNLDPLRTIEQNAFDRFWAAVDRTLAAGLKFS